MAAIDQQTGLTEGLTGPADNQVLVSPNDTTDLAYISRAIYVGSAGTLKVTPSSGQTPVTYTVTAGAVLPIRCSRIWSTGTSAGNIVAWY